MIGTQVCAVQTTYFNSSPNYKYNLADEIAEPRPDMNITVTALTVSKKFFYTVTVHEVQQFRCSGRC